MRYTVFIALFFLSAIVVHGQDALAYTDVEKENFVAVFWEIKEYPKVEGAVVQAILKDAGISPDRYGEMIRSQIEGDKIKPNEAERAVLSAIRDTQDSYLQEKSEFENSSCTRHGLSTERYNEILQAYRSNIEFQHSMRPFFNAYMEEGKK